LFFFICVFCTTKEDKATNAGMYFNIFICAFVALLYFGKTA